MLACAACDTEHVLGVVASRPGGSDCGQHVAGPDLTVCTATYVAGKADERAAAVDIGADDSVLVAANIEDQSFAEAARIILPGVGAGAGAVLRLQADGRRVRSVTRLPADVLDLQVQPTPGRGDIVVLTSTAVLVLGPAAADLVWTQPISGVRATLGSDGTVAVLESDGTNVTVFAADGLERKRFALGLDGAAGTDVAVHGELGQVVVVGTRTSGATRQPFVRAFEHSGRLRWAIWGWDDAQARARGVNASAFGRSVAFGRDGALYYLGDSHGGRSVHGWDPHDPTKQLNDPDVEFFSNPYQTRKQILYWARLSATDGRVQAGRFLLTRESGTMIPRDGNSVFGAAIAADELGQVLVTGTLDCCLDHPRTKVGGVIVDAGDGDAFLALYDVQRTRVSWTTFGAPGSGVGAAIARGKAAVVALQPASSTAPFATSMPIQPQRPGGGDSWLVVFPTP